MTEQEKADDLREMAGECVKCIHYNYADAVYGDPCYECSRYHADMFEEKAAPCK